MTHTDFQAPTDWNYWNAHLTNSVFLLITFIVLLLFIFWGFYVQWDVSRTLFVPSGVSRRVDSPIIDWSQQGWWSPHTRLPHTHTLTFCIFIAWSGLGICLCQLLLVVNSCFGRKKKSFMWKWRVIIVIILCLSECMNCLLTLSAQPGLFCVFLQAHKKTPQKHLSESQIVIPRQCLVAYAIHQFAACFSLLFFL